MHAEEGPELVDDIERRPRRRRPRELWTRETEPYPGALVLWDLDDAGDEDAAVILARFAVARWIMVAAHRGRGRLRRERHAVHGYLRQVPVPARGPLLRLLRKRAPAPRSFYRALRATGMQAAEYRHAGGAYTFLRLAYEIAIGAAQRRPAARIAAHLARLAAVDDAPYSARVWTERVRVLLAAPPLPRARPLLALPPGSPAPAQVPERPARSYVADMDDTPERGAASGGGYGAEARRALQAALAAGTLSACPACGAPLAVNEVAQPTAVSYVRRRVWVLCTGCRRSASIDVPHRP